jgi:hypothetical protein
VILLLALVGGGRHPAAEPSFQDVDVDVFARAAATSERDSKAALAELAERWKPGYAAMVLDLAELSRWSSRAKPQPTTGFAARRPDQDPDAVVPDEDADADIRQPPRFQVRDRLLQFLEKQTGQRFGNDFVRWHRWIWSLPYEPHRDLARFKGLLYGNNIDPRMEAFFPADVPASIRLDEIEWGGVTVNGIPPLVYPAHLSAADAGYLRDDHVVFGLDGGSDRRDAAYGTTDNWRENLFRCTWWGRNEHRLEANECSGSSRGQG